MTQAFSVPTGDEALMAARQKARLEREIGRLEDELPDLEGDDAECTKVQIGRLTNYITKHC